MRIKEPVGIGSQTIQM